MKFSRLNEAFFAALNKLIKTSMPAKYALKLKRLVAKLEPEHQRFIELRKQLLDEYMDKDVDRADGMVQIKQDKLGEFQQKHLELLEEEVEAEFDKIPFSVIADLDVSAEDLLALEDILDEDN